MTSPADAVVFRLARRDPGIASVRYRGLTPALALRDRAWRVTFSSGSEAGLPAALGFAVKPLAEADSTWTIRRREAGTPVVVDLCDNIFVEGYGGTAHAIAERFVRTVAGCTVTVPTTALREEVMRHCALPEDRVLLVPDVVETPQLLHRQLRMLGQPASRLPGMARRTLGWLQRARRVASRRPVLLWFGHHGAGWGRFGLSDLMLVRDALQEAARRHRAVLWVVSNHRARFDALQADLPIETRYFEWTPHVLDRLLAAADVCLVPNSLDGFARTKSANRALKALAAGVPVVATPTPACLPLGDCLWLGDAAEGIAGYLGDPVLRARHLTRARERIAHEYSLAAVGAAVERATARALEAA